jgi:hypothetical protein
MCAHGKGAGLKSQDLKIQDPKTLDPGRGILWRTAVYIPYAYSIMYPVPRALGSIYAWRGDSRDLE